MPGLMPAAPGPGDKPGGQATRLTTAPSSETFPRFSPDDQTVALTHWSAGGIGETDPAKQVGVWQYCAEVSGEAVETFVRDYPQQDSPEPSVAL